MTPKESPLFTDEEIMEDNYIKQAKRRCKIVIDNNPDIWEGELLVRMNKLIKRNYQEEKPYRYDKAEIEEIRKLLGWNETIIHRTMGI